MHSYEEWTRSEIGRLRADAQKVLRKLILCSAPSTDGLELQGLNSESARSEKEPTRIMVLMGIRATARATYGPWE